jgi:hypothetical protein
MPIAAIAAGYKDAIAIVHKAKLEFIGFKPINDKLWNVIEYLERSAKEELSSVLG